MWRVWNIDLTCLNTDVEIKRMGEEIVRKHSEMLTCISEGYVQQNSCVYDRNGITVLYVFMIKLP